MEANNRTTNLVILFYNSNMFKGRLEIAVENKEEAIIAEKAGADRIEISTNLEKRGLTVSVKDITNIVVSVNIPSYVMIKPSSSSYEFTEEEFSLMLQTIELCKLANVKGIIIGFLKKGKIDRERLEKIINIKGDLEIVINRAIDSVVNYEKEVEYLVTHPKINYIQTSGAAETVFDGRFRLKPLIMKYPDKFILSSGLNKNIIEKLIDEDIDRVIYQMNSGARKNGNFNTFFSFDKISEVKGILKNN